MIYPLLPSANTVLALSLVITLALALSLVEALALALALVIALALVLAPKGINTTTVPNCNYLDFDL